MANTTVTTGKSVEITVLDSDWDPAVSLAARLVGQHLYSVKFTPGAASDVLIVRNGTSSGARIFRCKCTADTDDRKEYFNERSEITPFITHSECTFSAGAIVMFQ